MNVAGMSVIFTPVALEATPERLFPESKHRSARIRKKLIKRFGGEFVMKPCIFRMGNTFYAHPVYEREFRNSLATRMDNSIHNAICGYSP